MPKIQQDMLGGRPNRLVAVGAICSTTIFRVDDIPHAPGKALASQMIQVIDGMALSAAFAFTKLGGNASILGRIGDDEQGRRIPSLLQREGLDSSGLHTVAGSATSQVSVVVDQKGDRLVVTYHDPETDQSPDWLPQEKIAQAGLLHCDVRWKDGAFHALNIARELGVPSMVDGDVAPVETLHCLMPLADYAVFSDAGIFRYSGCSDVISALKKVGPSHHGHVGASCGPEGYYWYVDGEICHVPAPKVQVVDTLCAGDVFHGALALALLEGKNMTDSARFACAAASLKCTKFGGRLGCPERNDVDRLMSETYQV